MVESRSRRGSQAMKPTVRMSPSDRRRDTSTVPARSHPNPNLPDPFDHTEEAAVRAVRKAVETLRQPVGSKTRR